MAISITDQHWARRFFTIWIGQAFSLAGSALVQFAVVWWLTVSTGSATVLATATLLAMLPEIIVGPFAGAVVDRWSRRVIMIVADAAIMMATLCLVVLFATQRVEVWHIYALLMVRSLGSAFHWPAMQASTTLLVPDNQLTRVAGLNQTLRGGIAVVAPLAGALAVSALPMQGVLLIDVATAALGVGPLLVIAIPQPVRKADAADAQPPSYWHDLREGLYYVAAWRGLLIIGIMVSVLNFLFTPAFSLLPLLVTKHFGGQAMELGLINAVEGLGFLSGGIVLSIWGGFRRRVFTSILGLVGIGVGAILIGLAPAAMFGLALVAVFVTGFMTPITNGPLFAALQSLVAPEMQGRVLSLIGSVASAMSPLSLAVAGPLADVFGIRVWYVIAGVASVAMAVAMSFIPAVVHIEERHTASPGR